MKLIATKAFGYNGAQLEAEQEFEASSPHAKALIALRKARVHDEGEAPAPARKKAKEAKEPEQDEAGDKKRGYNRRDMKAK